MTTSAGEVRAAPVSELTAAVDNFLVQDPLGRPFMEQSQLARR